MKILVVGATGGTGREVVKQALARGHEVTVFARRPEALGLEDARLRVVKGDITTDAAKFEEAVRGHDAVVSGLGRGTSFSPENLMVRAMEAVVPAMERAGVHRFIFTSAFGVGESHGEAPLLPRITYRTLLKDLFADKAKAEGILRGSSLDWTIVRPVVLTNGAMTGKYRAEEHLEGLHGIPTISRADVAHFIVGELEKPAFVRKTAAISY